MASTFFSRFVDAQGKEQYHPAYELKDASLERNGRK